MSWLTDWNEASEKPGRTILMLFVGTSAGMGAIAYFGPAHHNVAVSAIAGGLVGTLIALLGIQEVDRVRSQEAQPATSKISVFTVLSVATFLVILAIGIAERSQVLVASALPFLAFAAISVGIRHHLRRRRSRA